MAPSDTKTKIIKAAAELFAVHGFHHTSLRAITGRAGVNLAAVNYHFGSKEGLLEALLDHHLIPLNEVRLKRLHDLAAQARRSGRIPAVAEVLRCFTEPTLALLHDDNAATGHFRMLIGRAFTDPDQTVRYHFQARVQEVLALLLDLLCQAQPKCCRQSVAWKLQFALGAMGHTLTFQGRGLMVGGLVADKGVGEVVEMLTEFMVRGMAE